MNEAPREVKRLIRLVEHTDGNLIAFALFERTEDKERIIELLERETATPINNVSLSGNALNPLNFLNAIPKTPRQMVNFALAGNAQHQSDLEKLAGYLNIQREGFNRQPHAAIFWLNENHLDQIMRLAPDFSAWRSGGVFDFVVSHL